MPSHDSKAALRAELGSLLVGRDPHAWIEEATMGLLHSDGQLGPPVELRSSLLQHLRINCFYFDAALSVPGQLNVGGDGFSISVRATLGRVPARWRLVVAHEMSHAMLYDPLMWPPRRRDLSPLGSRPVEDLCWYGARCLLMPARFVELNSRVDAIGVRSSPPLLAVKFQVSQYAMAMRMLRDMDVLRGVALGFEAKYHDLHPARSTGHWRLRWHVKSPEPKGLFIPAAKPGGSLPKATERLAEFLTACVSRGREGRFVGYDEVDVEVFKGRTTGSLYKILLQYCGTNRLMVLWHCWATPSAQQDALPAGEPKGMAYVTVYIVNLGESAEVRWATT